MKKKVYPGGHPVIHALRAGFQLKLKNKVYKLFLILMVSLSLGSGPVAQREIARMLEALSGTGVTQVQELDEEEKVPEEIKKKFPNYFKDIITRDDGNVLDN